METQIVKLSSIKPNPANPRVIKDAKFDKLVKSIREFPQMLSIRPIVVNDDGIILGGNMRLKACKEAGHTEAPVLYASDLTPEQQREFIIKDNVGFGEWDWELIESEWDSEELDEWGLDVPDFEPEEDAAQDDDYEMPDEVHTDFVLGDLIEIGEHRLLCGDSTDSDTVAKLMNGEKAEMVFTDPMYQDSPLPIISIFNIIDTKYFLIMATFKQCMSFVNDSGFRFRFDLVFNQKVPSSTMNKKVPYYLHKNLIYLTKDDTTIFDCDNAKGFFFRCWILSFNN